ncbi:MAG: hypothetical protein OCD03_00305 [Hyphomicrobiales bacterium]
MYELFNKFYNKQTEGSARGRTYMRLISVPFVISFLALDSKQFAEAFFDARNLVNFIVICFFFILLSTVDNRLRRLMLIMVPLSYLGEQVVCNLLNMYDYREYRIPLWVPFAHGILYGFGYIFSQLQWAIKNERIMRRIFTIFFASIFIIAGLFYSDILTLILAILYFHAIRHKKWNSLYFYISAFALMAEYVGTYFGIWQWHTVAFGFIPTLNPPSGAIYIYIGGDAVLLKLMRYMDRKKILTPLDRMRDSETW